MVKRYKQRSAYSKPFHLPGRQPPAVLRPYCRHSCHSDAIVSSDGDSSPTEHSPDLTEEDENILNIPCANTAKIGPFSYLDHWSQYRQCVCVCIILSLLTVPPSPGVKECCQHGNWKKQWHSESKAMSQTVFLFALLFFSVRVKGLEVFLSVTNFHWILFGNNGECLVQIKSKDNRWKQGKLKFDFDIVTDFRLCCRARSENNKKKNPFRSSYKFDLFLFVIMWKQCDTN